MSDTETETFETLEEELEYWKLKYTNKSLELVELEEQFDEYRQYTKDVEEELAKGEARIKELERSYALYKQETQDMLQVQKKSRRQSQMHISSLEENLEGISQREMRLRTLCRELEQKNDELEQRDRESNATIEYLQERLDKITEQYVLSQGELETLRVSSDEVIERLKDEVRDQKTELHVKSTHLEALKRAVLSPVESASGSGLTCDMLQHSFGFSPSGPLRLVSEMIHLVKELEDRLRAASGITQSPSQAVQRPTAAIHTRRLALDRAHSTPNGCATKQHIAPRIGIVRSTAGTGISAISSHRTSPSSAHQHVTLAASPPGTTRAIVASSE